MSRKSINPAGYRKCPLCQETFKLSKKNFYRDKTKYLGFMYRCKSCYRKIALARWHQTENDKIKEQTN